MNYLISWHWIKIFHVSLVVLGFDSRLFPCKVASLPLSHTSSLFSSGNTGVGGLLNYYAQLLGSRSIPVSNSYVVRIKGMGHCFPAAYLVKHCNSPFLQSNWDSLIMFNLNYSFENIFQNSLMLWVRGNIFSLFSLTCHTTCSLRTHMEHSKLTATFVNIRSLHTTLINPQFKEAV
jgi:hypothetical protein